MITLPPGPPAAPSLDPQRNAPVAEAETSQPLSDVFSTHSDSRDAAAFQQALDQEQVRLNSPPASAVKTRDAEDKAHHIARSRKRKEFAPDEEDDIPSWAPPPAAGAPLPANGSSRRKRMKSK
jgi:hypothetical protein